MVVGNITTKVSASSNENAKKIGTIFNNIATQIEEKDLMSVYEKINEYPKFLANIIKKLDNPLIKRFL